MDHPAHGTCLGVPKQLKDNSCSLLVVHAVTSLPHCGLENLCKSLSRNKTIQKPMLELIECNEYGDMHVSHMAKTST